MVSKIARKRAKPKPLTPKEILALRMWRRGKTTRQIAATFMMSPAGGWKLLTRARAKLGEMDVDWADWMNADEVIHGE